MHHPSRSPSSSASWLAWAAPVALAALLGACSGNDGSTSTGSTTTSTTGNEGGGGSGGGGGSSSGSGGGPTPDTPRDFFNQVVLPGLTDECGACHELGGSADNPFLAKPDAYVSITSWPGIVVADAAKSILVVHPNEQSHGAGQAPGISEELKATCLEWLAKEAKNLPEAVGALTFKVKPFKPILGGALNTVYLDEIDPSLQYASISFNAKELAPSLLQLKNLEIHPVEGQAVHIIHPLFTVYPAKAAADPDPVDSFSGVDQLFTLDGNVELGTGEIILSNWEKDAFLGIAFEQIKNEGGGGPPTDCVDPTMFKDVVVPQMKYCADTCHGGANEKANATMDLSKLGDPMPLAACAQVRARITPGDPDNSKILIVTDPKQQAVHMYKFMGNTINYKAFKDAVSPWIDSEAK
jgi:hypothetical protein